MEVIIILAIVAYIIIKLISFMNKVDNTTQSPGKEKYVSSNKTYTSKHEIPKGDYGEDYTGRKAIGLSARKGYEKFQIAGAYYRNLPVEMVGRFNGYAMAETNNEYDPFAIGIYNDAGMHLGFLPRGNEKLHSYILDEGGRVHAYGYLGYNSGMYGETCVETDKNLVTKRNKPYATN